LPVAPSAVCGRQHDRRRQWRGRSGPARRDPRRHRRQRRREQIAQRRGLEITVRLENGEMRAITQDADEVFRPGDRVRLLPRAA
jgi:hypothetical protein